MESVVKIYSKNLDELSSFLRNFYAKKVDVEPHSMYWEQKYENPIEISDIVAAFIDNKSKYSNCNMWVSLDFGTYINITESNYNYFIQYLFERYPY